VGYNPNTSFPVTCLGVNFNQRYKSLSFNVDLNRTGSYIAPVFENNFPFRMAELKFDGYTKADIYVNFERRVSERVLAVFFGGLDNLFDQRYFENGFRAPRAVARAGVNFKF